MEADFQGYATKANLLCSDGRTILPNAFQHQDTMTVPLVWQHGHNNPKNVLGHAILENREDGVWAKCFFNTTDEAQHARTLVRHGDIKFMSIWANQLMEKAKKVIHGMICEVSLVLKGANPGALIDPLTIRHSDGSVDEVEDEAIITTGIEIEVSHADSDTSNGEDDEKDGPTIAEVYDSLTDLQKEVVHFMLGEAIAQKDAEHSNSDNNSHSSKDENQEGKNTVTHNVFEKKDDPDKTGGVLSHDDMKSIVDQAKAPGHTFMSALKGYALEHGITDIETLFPEAVAIDGAVPEWVKRDTEWVGPFLAACRKSPFSRIKSRSADLTFENARAKGYIKGNLKKEQFFAISQRETTPKTIYKKQKLDRDDILDVDEFDLVAWLKPEMRFMIEEEIARAALIGDGRDVADEDKIDETKIRPIATDDEFYTTRVYVNVSDASSTMNEVVDALILNRSKYKGSGTPNMYMSESWIGRFLTLRKPDSTERMYKTLGDLAAEIRVAQIIPVEVMEDAYVEDIVGVIVNPRDYVFGATRGGQLTTFEDFDIDYNQQKYLIETRLCGALVKPKSAVVVISVPAAAALVVPVAPTFDPETGALTITDTTGVVYKHGATTINAAGSPYTVDPGTTWVVDATPASASYYFATSDDDQWTFTADA